MFQQCPQCMTLLNITPETLAGSDGTITCDHCHSRFAAAVDADKNRPIIDAQAQANLMTEALQAPTPRSALRWRRHWQWQWLILSLLLSLLLATQGTYFNRNELAAHSSLRPVLHGFCLMLGCELKLLRDLGQLRIVSREVRSHPSINNALQINLTLRNEAAFRQPWPTLQLTFSDINNTPLAQRSFSPRDYLPIGTDLADGMPAQVPINTSLVLIDPGPDAVNFVFDFM